MQVKHALLLVIVYNAKTRFNIPQKRKEKDNIYKSHSGVGKGQTKKMCFLIDLFVNFKFYDSIKEKWKYQSV